MKRLSRFVVFSSLSVLAATVLPLRAQQPVQTGTPPFGSFASGMFDIVNLANSNAHFSIPVFSRPGRGVPFSYNLTYDTSVWYPVGVSGNQTWTPMQNWGWLAKTAVATGELTALYTSNDCWTYIDLTGQWVLTGGQFTYQDWAYIDPWGIRHPFNAMSKGGWGNCNGVPIVPGQVQDINVTAPDGSGYTLQTMNGEMSMTDSAWVTSRAGTVSYPPINSQSGAATYTDRNGNRITTDGGGNFTDTLGGAPVLSISGSNPLNFTYQAPGPSGIGTSAVFKLNYTTYTVSTNFGVSGINEYGRTSVALVSSIALTDNSQYTLTYEPTPSTPASGACTPLSGTYSANCVTGRLNSITLPAGGTIQYTYTGGSNGIYSDGTVPVLTRVTPDGTWTYSRTQISGSHWQTTISDPTLPSSNQTVIDFQGIYETQRLTYQGPASGGTLLETIVTCYNGNFTNCATTAVNLPIRRVTQTIQYSDASGKQCEHDAFYSSYGLQTELDDYDYGNGVVGSPIRKVLTSYASLGNGIVGMPSSITVQDGSGATKAQTTFTYDEGTLTSLSGTPQWSSITGSRGNATTIKKLVQGTTFLTTTVSYYNTGNPNTLTDVNGAQTTYNYPDSTSTCGNSFPKSVTLPITNPALSLSFMWNCIGGVLTQLTDENSKTTTTAYTDPYFWHPASITDPANAVTSFYYPTSAPYNWREAKMTFNSGNSLVDVLTTVDGVARTHIKQVRQGPGSNFFDSAQSDYDSLGRASRVTAPYVATVGVTNPNGPATRTTYDALNRTLQVTDAAGGTATYSYMKNDVNLSLGPAPTGENAKRRQFEYDSIGHLTSVCEITSAAQSGTCGQTSSQIGYWTKYSYDVLGNLTGVTQNAQPGGTQQTRSYTYDGLSRLTSETNGETGTVNYTFDSATGCTGTFSGDLVKRVDAVGNTTCYAYDPLHRVTSATYSGPYAPNTPNKYFVYDAATINTTPTATTMVNAKRHLAEAYTATSPTGTKITDVGFSYSARGEISDVYQATPNSGAYYHLSATYWPHGSVNQLSGLSGLPTLTYGVDSEGRVSAVSASPGQNPVNSTVYNVASQPTQLNFGSLDSDSFSYDANIGHMTQYKFNVNTQSLIGNLTWNQNGTLGALSITDPFNSADTQNCSYAHDDLMRIANVNCGAVWSQTFSYDPLGNINKNGSVSFTPFYSATTNRMTSFPGGFTPTYDNNGNALNDGTHTYTWDAEGRPLTVDGVGLTYDALLRMVEQNRSGAYTEIVYAPTGDKLALMSGQSLVKAFVPLPGSSTAVYTSTGLSYYRHADWLGSNRLTSSPSQAVLSSIAYGPFGETYAQFGTADPSFTGQNQDTSGGVYDFRFREYATQGRWPSPDPARLAAADLSNPQSLNRYAYVLNNPLGLVDPLGLVNDCGGPCSDFCEWDSNGCLVCVHYHTVIGQDGNPYDMPEVTITCDNGRQGCVQSITYRDHDAGIANANCATPPPQPNGSGFTLGIRVRGQTFNQCMVRNAANYSAGGVFDVAVGTTIGNSTAGQVLAGNTFTGLYSALAGSAGDAATVAGTATPDLLNKATGSPLTFGRRTSNILSLNLAGKGGLPQALSSSSGGLKSLLGYASKALNLGLDASLKAAGDFGLFGAEIIGCSVYR